VFVACLVPLKKLCHSAGHYVARLLSGGMVGLVGVAPYQPDGRQIENILLMISMESLGFKGALHSDIENIFLRGQINMTV
jgi:hypothetical protein